MLASVLKSQTAIQVSIKIMDKYKIENRQGVFVQGQIFDAYITFQNLIQKAPKEIILIDNYIDLTVLERLAKKKLE